jgi:DNA polymerase elongation subunit (family B)
LATQEELLEKRAKIKKRMYEIEDTLKDKTFVSSVDFASMYPSVIRLLNASIENLVGFLDDDPVVYRTLGMSEPFRESKERSKELVKTTLKDSKYVQFVGKNEDKVALRRDIYAGKYADASIEEITETPFERFFLATMGLFDADEVMMKFQGEIYTVNELNQLFEEKNYSVSGSGAVYSKDEQGLIPAYLEYLFFERKKVKKEMFHHYHHKTVLQKFKNAAEADGLLK